MNKKEKLLKIHKFFYHSALKQLRIVILFLPAGIFLSVFFVIAYVNQNVKKETLNMQLPERIFSDFHPVSYPVLRYTNGAGLGSSLSAQGAVIMDSDSKVVLYAKNPQTRFSMASSTKIMSALVALDYYRLDAVLTIQAANVPPAIVGYPRGEKVKFLDVLYGLLLPSGNDAALAIAQNYPGGASTFIAEMNKKAHDLSLYDSHFSDSSGLDDSGDYTTVLDLAKLASEAIKNPLFKKIVSTKSKLTSNLANTKTYYLTNINELLGKYGVNGIKTGFTPEAGGILVTSSIQNGHTVIIVVMKSEDRFADTEKLLSGIAGNITYLSIVP